MTMFPKQTVKNFRNKRNLEALAHEIEQCRALGETFTKEQFENSVSWYWADGRSLNWLREFDFIIKVGEEVVGEKKVKKYVDERAKKVAPYCSIRWIEKQGISLEQEEVTIELKRNIYAVSPEADEILQHLRGCVELENILSVARLVRKSGLTREEFAKILEKIPN